MTERSPEVESVVRRVAAAWTRDTDILRNLVSSDAALRVLGSDTDEWWEGQEQLLRIRESQADEMPDLHLEIGRVEGFEEGGFGWATLFTTMVTPEASTPLRHTAVLRLEAGVWRVIQWHNSSPTSNQQVFGVELTTTLDDLVSSVLDDKRALAAAGSEGTLTLAFTDIVDSTVHAESMGDAAWTEMIASHASTIREAAESENGTVVKLLGDGSMLAFESARSAIRSAVHLQRASAAGEFAVRIGIHTGEVIRTGGDLYGLTVNKAARVAAAAGPGQVMISSTTRDLAGSMEGVRMGEPKIVALKGLSDAHQIIPIEWD